MCRCHYDIFSGFAPSLRNKIATQWDTEAALNGAALLDLYLTEVMEIPAECDDR